MAWLSVPGVEGWNSDSPSPSETPTAPSVTSSGKPMRPQSWWRAWKKKGGWIRLLSGTTLRPSMADAGVAAWISSLRASRASPSAPPGNVTRTTIADTSGRMSGGLSTGHDRVSSFWRTSEPLFQLDNGTGDRRTWWSETSWSDWVTALRRRSSAHRTWAHHISGSGSSSWASLTQHDGRRPGSDVTSTQGANLKRDAEQWPTPMTVTGGPAGQGPNGTSRDRDLQREAQLWQTPRTDSFRSRGGDRKHEMGLDQEARFWPTPGAEVWGSTAEQHLARKAKMKDNPNRKSITELGAYAGAWQTPGTDSFRSRGGDRKHEMGLDQEARFWQTPKVATGAYSYPSGDKTRPFLNLEGQAETFHLDPETPTPGPPSLPSAPNSHRLWPSPDAQMFGSANGANWTQPATITDAAKQWQTPRVGPHGPPGQGARHGGQPKGMRLNPLFVEWLMGWPPNWSSVRSITARSDSDFSATAWCHWLRRSRSALARMHSALR